MRKDENLFQQKPEKPHSNSISLLKTIAALQVLSPL